MPRGPIRGAERRPATRGNSPRARSCLAVPIEDLLLLDRAVSFVDTDDECEAERQCGDANDDGGQDEHVGQGIRVHAIGGVDDGSSAADDFRGFNVEQIDRGYQNIDIRLQKLGAQIVRK